MAERLRVTENGRTGYVYPVGEDAERVARAGGLSKLSKEEQDAIGKRLKRVVPGDFCDDMPASTIEIYLERGWIERVPAPPAATAAGRQKGDA